MSFDTEVLIIGSEQATKVVPPLSGSAAIQFINMNHSSATVYYSTNPAVGRDGTLSDGSLAASDTLPLESVLYLRAARLNDYPASATVVVTSFGPPTGAVTPNDSTTVGTSPVTLFNLNPDRNVAGFTVYHATAIVWVSRAGTATAGEGEPVYPYERWRTEDFAGPVSIVSDTASTPIAFFEV